MFPKPPKGSATAERRKKSRLRSRRESEIMSEARHRDGNCCRYCGSTTDTEVAHLRHRGMGGNPSMDRTHVAGLITLCRQHHRAFDSKTLKIATGPMGADGTVEFIVRKKDQQEIED